VTSNRSRSNRSVGNKLNNLDSRVSRNEKGTNNPHLNPDVIEEQHLTDASVAEAKLADRAVTENKIARGAVGTEHLGIVNTITADSGLTLKPGPDGGFIVIDGAEYVAPAAGSGELFALGFNELNQVVVSSSGIGGGDGVAAMPAGSIQAWPSNTIPEGWLLCDGAAVSRTTYAALFTAIGTTFGAGNGTTTFNLPDLRSRVIAGYDDPAPWSDFRPLGRTGGERAVTLTTEQIPAHSHTGTTNTDGSHRHWVSAAARDDANFSTTNSSNTQDYGLVADAGSYSANDADKAFGRYTSFNLSNHSHAFTTNNNTGGGGSHTNLQPYIVLNYIIKHMVADGMEGPAGPQGEAGDAASVTVGTTTTGAAGSVAVVSNAGTSSAAVLNFTIPRGNTGATGSTGPQGPSGTVAVGSTSTGVEGTEAQVTNSGTSTNAVLEFVIPRGDAASIAVGTTTTGEPGTEAEVTNSGDGSNAVFDFVIPEGIGATADVGTVTTVTEDDEATVTNSGTTVDAVFDFEIPQGKTGDSAGVQYEFSTATSDTDPTDGVLKFDSATPASITYLYIDNVDAGAVSRTAWYDQWDVSTSLDKGQIYLGEYRSDAVAIFNVTGDVIPATGYYKVPVEFVSGTLPADEAVCYVMFSKAGDIGNETPFGGTTGQILSKASDEDYDFEWVDNTPFLASLLDVEITEPIEGGQALTYDDATEKWVNATPATTLDSLTDVELTEPLEDGQALTYDLATDTWINATPASTLDSLTDVDISTIAPEDGDVLSYDAIAEEWIAQSAGNATLPAGSVMAWGGDTAPAGWLLCTGQEISRTEYASLFSAIGTSFGVGDTVATFNVPDLRGRTAFGRDETQTEFDVLGETGGSKTTTFPTFGDGTSTGNGLMYSESMSSVDDGTYNNLPPYQTLNYIIKYTSGESATDESQLTDRVSELEIIVDTAYNQLPAGAIMAWGSETAPSNWLSCDGSAVSRSLYASLYAAIGDAYGAGDGTTTFNLPNLKGRVPVGVDGANTAFDTLGETGGDQTHSLDGTGTATGYGLMYGESMDTADTTGTNMPPYQVVHYVIKATAGITEEDSALTDRVSTLEATVGSMFPAGTILASAITTAPDGWAICDGSAVSRSTYASLYAAIGTTYGVGDNVTTFNLPNLKGRTIFGLDSAQTEFDTLGESGGNKLIQGHGSGTATGYGLTYSESVLTTTGLTTAQNLPPYTALNYLIRLVTATPDAESEFVTRLGELETFVENGGNESPAGSIMAWGALTAPTNWLLCDGSVVLRASWPSLYNAIGTQYNTGGETGLQFRLPNLQGRVAVGRDSTQTEFDTLGEVGGAKTHTLTTAEMPSHTHIQDAHNHTQNSHNHTQDSHNHSQNSHVHDIRGGYVSPTNNSGFISTPTASGGAYGFTYSTTEDTQPTTATNNATTATNQATTATNIATTATNQNTGGGEAHNNLQPYIVLNYIIKATSGVSTTDSIIVSRVGTAELDIEAVEGRATALEGRATAVEGRATSLETRATALELADSTTNRAGLVPAIPASVSVGSGSASVSTSGLVTFSGATSLSLNSVFTSSYSTYRIITTLSGSAAGAAIYMRLRASSSDSSTGSYFYAGSWQRHTNTSYLSWNGAGTTFFDLGRIQSTAAIISFVNVDITNPLQATRTNYTMSALVDDNNSPMWINSGGVHVSSTSFDGFTIYPTSGNFTGTIQVYGYR
jgi:microcystin-dependent protein